MTRCRIGLQLYTLREVTSKDFLGTLKQVAQFGYEGVEFAGYGGISAEDMRSELDRLGLKAIASHVGLQRLREHLEEEIAYNKAIGSDYIIVPYLSKEQRENEAAWNDIFVELNQLGRLVREAGLGFGYHNHAFEFEDHVNGSTAFDAMLSDTDSESVQVELDTCWVQVAGYDPVAYMRKCRGRLPLVHLKDYGLVGNGVKDTVPLGTGEIDLERIVRESKESGVEWLIVEQDRVQQPALDSVRISMEWLNNIG
jgi:sugar phosphate isomerase/epimerase